MKGGFDFQTEKLLIILTGAELTIPSIVFAVTPNKEVIALKQFRYGINNVVVELPGGCPSEDETIEKPPAKNLKRRQVIMLSLLQF